MPDPVHRAAVWIVDDNPLEREHARRALAVDFDTEVFADGSAVLERLANGSAPDVLVLDWLMPGVTGIEVCKYLRSSTATLETPVLLMTAQREVAQIVEGSARGERLLTKPYAAEELRARTGALARSKLCASAPRRRRRSCGRSSRPCPTRCCS